MTTYRATTSQSRFNAAFANHHAAATAAATVQNHPDGEVRSNILVLAVTAADTFFNTPAPSLDAVAIKLEKYWGEALFDDADPHTAMRQIIVGDLRRIERLLAGVEEPDATGGMDLERVDHDWADALREYERSEIAALKQRAETKLLSLRAPHLVDVLKKLELLWAGTTESGVHLLILNDLRQFADRQPQ